MSFRRFLLPVCAFALLCVQSCLAQSDGDAIANGDDSRLKQTVTFSADGIALSDALGQLSTSTGVTLNAGLNDQDWAVRDRKVIVEVADMPLADLMQQLSSTLRFRWSRGTDGGKSVYRLWQDKKAREEEESLRSAQDSAQSAQAREKRENGLADMVNLGSLNAADAAKLKATDPWRYVLATEPLGRDVADLMSHFSDARGAFVQGTEASFPVMELPGGLQNTVRRIAESYDSLTKSIGNAEDHSALLARFDKLQITINRRTPGKSDIVSQSMLGRITISSGADSFDIPMFDPSSAVGKALGKAIISLKGGASKDQVGTQLQTEMAAAIKNFEAAQPSTRDITSDPELRAKVKLFDGATTATLPVALKALAAKTKLNVISDCFPGGAPVLDGTEKSLGTLLEGIRTAYGSNWTKAGHVLIFRDKDWFTKRAWAIPEVWVKYWTERGKLNNGLLMDDMAQIADLRDEQIDRTVMTDPTMVRLGAGESARNRQILRFYATLKPDQRKQMTDGKLEASALTDEQWSVLKTALATKGAAYAAVQRGDQFLRFAQSAPDAVELTYTISYYATENDPPVTFKLTSGVVFSGFPQKGKEPAPAKAQ